MPPVVSSGSQSYQPPTPGPVVAIGNFDGVHVGHRALLARARELADDGIVCAYTFDPLPREVLRSEAPGRIQALEDRVAALGEAGADHVVVERFDRAFAAHDAGWFCDEVLHRRLRASAVVVGFNFRFGRERGGDVASLAAALAVPVVRVAPVELDGEPVSSTRIREALLAGRVADAARMLGRPHVVSGPVLRGDARGRTLGFPTANVLPDRGLTPARGVYAVRARLPGGEWHPAVANLGVRPTFGPGVAGLEVHLLDFAGDLYDRRLEVAFVARIRDEQRFPSLDALVARITRDVEQARVLLGAG